MSLPACLEAVSATLRMEYPLDASHETRRDWTLPSQYQGRSPGSEVRGSGASPIGAAEKEGFAASGQLHSLSLRQNSHALRPLPISPRRASSLHAMLAATRFR